VRTITSSPFAGYSRWPAGRSRSTSRSEVGRAYAVFHHGRGVAGVPLPGTGATHHRPGAGTGRTSVAGRRPILQGMVNSLAALGAQFLQRPGRAVAILGAVALGIECAQYVPEVFLGAHAVGEVVRNLAYALIGAVIFTWLVVEIPARRRRRATYAFHEMTIRFLLILGPGLLKPYEEVAEALGEPLDVWDQASLSALASKIKDTAPGFFGPPRLAMLRNAVDTAIPRGLAELSPSASYLDPNVAHALSQFPAQEGLTTVLQVEATPEGGVEPHRDVHITWSLLEAARRLYPALLESGAYDSTIFQGTAGDKDLSANVLVKKAPA
jgi:hypothetical protein